MRVGYTLSGEEHPPLDLIRNGERAEDLGFELLTVSDHYHPWIGAQGESPFVWSVIGGLAAATVRAEVATFVTCPTIRIHPAIIAQAAATSASMLPGRFTLGVGSGEALNEHVLGDHWPPAGTRLDMLEEAIEVMRELWTGELVTYYGDFFTVEQARLHTRPAEPPPILVAGTGSKAAALAAENGGLIAVAPDAKLIEAMNEAGGEGNRAYAQINLAWAPDIANARKLAHTHWPQSALGKGVVWEIPTPELFEALVEGVTEDQAAEAMLTCSSAGDVIDAIREFDEAGFDSVSLHQVGPDQDAFLEFVAAEVLPAFS